MGCGGSKSVKTKNSTANSGTLTKRQIELVRESWDLVKPDISGHGITFYIR